LANQSFLSDWQIYIGGCYCILHVLGNKKGNLVEFNLADFCNSPSRQNNSTPNFHLMRYSSPIEYSQLAHSLDFMHDFIYRGKFWWWETLVNSA